MYYRLFLLFFLFTTCSSGYCQQFSTVKMQVTATGTATECNAVIYLPAGYSKDKTYPLVIYSHGLSQAGSDVNKLYTTGLPKVLKDGYRPSFDFIMVAPQSTSYSIAPEWLEGILQETRKRWLIDTNRIYLTGIDAGGWACYGSQVNGTVAFAKKFAAIATISAATQNIPKKAPDGWAKSRTPLWTIAGEMDKSYLSQNTVLVDAINKAVPGLASLTIQPGTGHGGWNAVYNGNVTLDGKTMWEWLYQFDRSTTFSKPHIKTQGAPALAAATTLGSAAETTPPTIDAGVVRMEAEAYTAMYGVRTQSTSDAGGGENVGWIDESDWMDYTMTVVAAGNYALTLRVAAEMSGAQVQLKNGSGAVLATVAIPNTGDYQRWKDVTINLSLPAGTQTLRLQSSAASNWNINWFEVAGTAANAITTSGAAMYAGTKIEAEQFEDRNGILLQATRDFAGGVQNTFDVAYGDWISYAVTAPAAGPYTLCFRVACDATGSRFQIKNDNGTVLTTVDVPNSNGWQTWRDATAVVTLAAGPQTLKLQSVGGTSWNLNYFEVVKTPLNAFASYTLQPNSGTSIYLPLGLNLAHLKPGDTLNIQGGTYNVIELGNFKGSETQPLIIRNRDGQVACKIIRLSNTPEYFKLLGNGDPGVNYGFKINGNYTTGSCLTAFGTDFEIAYIEGMQSKSGFFVKKNPVADDPQTQFPNYEMDNISIHHNYLHDITGEGMYIGHTGADGGQGGNPLLPVRMRNVEISYNKVDQTGWDGIQLANATTGNKIHHNTVTNFGTSKVYGQQAGILLGGNSQADIYDNTVKYGSGNGIQNFGFGLNKIYNNYLEKVGRNGTDRGYEGVYCNDIITKSESRPKQQIQAYNNTIKYPMPWGAIRVSGYNRNSLPATMQYNKLLLPNAPSNWEKLYFPTYVPNSIISNNTLITE